MEKTVVTSKYLLACTAIASMVLTMVSGEVGAEPMRDGATGLAVDPPPGYVASKAPLSRGAVAGFDVRAGAEKNSGCRVQFTPQPNGDATQDELNNLVVTPEWRETIKGSLSGFLSVRSVEVFDQIFDTQEIVGLQVVAEMKQTSFTPETLPITFFQIILDTPKGRTAVACVENSDKFQARRDEFVAVARGVTPAK